MKPLELSIPDELVDAIAERVAERLAPEQSPGYLNVDQAAEYLAAPKSRIYELVERRRVEHLRDGRRLLFTRAALDAVLRVHGDEAGCHPVATRRTNGANKPDTERSTHE